VPKKMAIKRDGKYLCGYCYKPYAKIDQAETCKESHNLIYLAISQEDLNRLVNFIYTKEESLLGETLVDRLQSYLKGSLINYKG
jgi:hypothetical protein